jgi:dTDP-4-dehydrorhamnose reductase
VTPLEFGDAVRRLTDAQEGLLRPGSKAGRDRAAERPSYTCLNVDRLEDELDRPQPTLDQDLAAIEAVYKSRYS